ncbi:DUF4097 family beta strand repeat-containing protein [Microbacterium abyssi]|uniref:DUF4097 family beta strand repeat-containing protein n=1 Tax=Microbacterium abyssi TaxID=2782166 RepID=UPI001887AC6D|nr:DUF4097 family beta strand repeat-containing protein [Microbacterium sp. A18JL241]
MNTEPQSPQGGHDVPLTPPPAASAASVSGGGASSGGSGGAPREPQGSGARAAAIAIAVFGGVVLLGAGGTAAFAAVHDVRAAAHSGDADTQSLDVDGIEGITLDADASNVTARFGDVDEATLEVTGARSGNWTLERDGDELIVGSPDRGFGWWFGNGWFGDGWFGDEQTVVLTLPQNLERAELDADFSLSAGSLDVEGGYGEVDIEVGAGGFSMDGSATSLDADVSAGRADLSLSGVDEADFTVSAGKIVAELTGSAPRSVLIDVSAGSLELTVPDEEYNLTQDVSAGSLDNGLNTSNDSRFEIDASVSAGSVDLRAAD